MTEFVTELAAEVIQLAHRTEVKLATAESCSAGALATLLADTPSSGDVFLGGFITYAKACKIELLGVEDTLLKEKSAVSGEVAAAMARGALARCSSADITIATTCVGGPDPDEDGNPVGLTFIALARRNGECIVERHELHAPSAGRIRGDVLSRALQLTRTYLLGHARPK